LWDLLDQKTGAGGRPRAGAEQSSSGGGVVCGVALMGGYIEDETDPTRSVVVTSSPVPIELSLQADETALVRLKVLEEGHRSSTAASDNQIHCGLPSIKRQAV